MVATLLGGTLLLTPLEPEAWPASLVLVIACSLLALVGAFAAAALMVYSPTKLGRLATTRAAAVMHELQVHEQEYDLLSWLLMLAGAGGALVALASPTLGAGAVTWLVFGALMILTCAALPVPVATRRAERVVMWLMPLLRPLRLVLRYPLLLPMLGVTRGVLRVFRIQDEAPRNAGEIAEEIMAAVTDSAQESNLADEERHWIENIVEFRELRVSEAMTPRTDVVAFEAQIPLVEAVQRSIETGYSRYPVYEEKVDHVVGVFYAKDALARLGNGASKQVPVSEVMRKPLFVPETMGVQELLRQFKASKVQMAIVLDEYGGTAGLISIEDILEEIVGEITDEFEADELDPITYTDDDRVVEISGRARIDEVNKALGCALPEAEEYGTVAGLVFSNLGKIPKVGDSVTLHGIEFEILSADERRIGRLRMRLPEPAPQE